jgi:hypothetical protein
MHSVHIAQLYNHKHTCNQQGCLDTIPPNAQLLVLQNTSHRPHELPDVLSFHRIWQLSSHPAAVSSAAQSSCNTTGEIQEALLCLYNHLRNPRATECFAALERLSLEAGERVEDRGEEQEDCSDNQAGGLGPDADPLYSAHDEVDGRTHVVGFEFPNEAVKLGRGRADAEKQRNLDEYDYEGAYSVGDCQRGERHLKGMGFIQANDAKGDYEGSVENVGDSKRKAEEDAQYSGPTQLVSMQQMQEWCLSGVNRAVLL